MIEGKKIQLRLFTPTDLEEVVALENSYDEQGEFLEPRFRSLMTVNKNYEASDGWWSEHRGALAISTKQARLLGLIGFFRPHAMTTGYEIGRAHV